MTRKSVKLLVITIVSIVIIAAAFISFHHQSVKLPQRISIDTTNQPTIGNPKAKTHIIAFEDLKCHNCMRYNVEIYPQIKKKYINIGKAKYTMINVAFIPGSLPAANAARCIYAQNKTLFFPYIKAIYDNQPPEEQNWATIPTLVNFADKLPGIDKKKLSQCIYRSPYTHLISNNLKISMTVMNGAVATPTLYVNGYIVKPLTIKRINQIIRATR